MSAWIKAENVTGIANIRLRGEDHPPEKSVFNATAVGGSHDYQFYEVSVDVGREIKIFSYSVTFKSVGKLWIKDPKFWVE